MASQTRDYYKALADHYDWFVWDELVEEQMEDSVPLLLGHQVSDVLDCACGTGVQAIPLAKAGFHVTGSDLSPEMLRRCREKSAEAGVEIDLIESDIRALRSRIRGQFDAVVCMGNVLPHLMTDEAVALALANVHDVLKPAGLLIIEMRYYDQLLQDQPRYIPFRVNVEEGSDRVTILYVFTYLENTVRVSVVFLIQHENGTVDLETESVEYKPITTGELKRLLQEGGFSHIKMRRRGQRLFCTAVKAGPASNHQI